MIADFTASGSNFTPTNITFSFNGTSDVIVTFNAIPIPEPAGMIMFVTIGAMALRNRRRSIQPFSQNQELLPFWKRQNVGRWPVYWPGGRKPQAAVA
jgi:hypothetical protein